MTETTMPTTSIDDLLKQLKALANPKRLQIIHLLMEGVHCNCELGEVLNMPPNLISHHMGILRDMGLVDAEQDAVDARWVYFSINETALAEFYILFFLFFEADLILPRLPTCVPHVSIVPTDAITVT